MVDFQASHQTFIERSEHWRHGCCIHISMRPTEGQCTDGVQQQSSHVQGTDCGQYETVFECHDSSHFPKQGLQAT
eukprot:14750358-Ditylum_brightwellii.AAC.2